MQSSVDQHAAFDFDDRPVVARVETDRFCERCGYNLRSASVRQDPRTDLLLCRCPECGKFHAANDAATAGRLWLRRMTTALLWRWILLIIVGAAALLFSQFATLGMFLVYLVETRHMASRHPQRYQEAWWTANAIVLALCVLWGSLGGFLCAAFLPHWRRWSLACGIVCWPLAVAFCLKLLLNYNPPPLMGTMQYVMVYTWISIAAGLPMVWLGRPMARGLIVILLPRRLRPAMGYLWLADGKPPPKP